MFEADHICRLGATGRMNAHLFFKSYPVARWLPLFAALLSALLLFAGQQLTIEIRDARDDAREDALVLLQVARLVRQIHPAGQQREALVEETRRFSHAHRVDYCNRDGCLTVVREPGALGCDDGWHWRSLCVRVASPQDPREQVMLRYSLDREHLSTARDLSLLAAILLFATLVGAVSTSRLLARASAAERRLRHAGEHDALTGLPNRAKFETAVSRQLSATQTTTGDALLLFVHVDGVRPAIDQFGHQAGDVLLVDAARRLQAFAGPQDVVARLEGAAFAVMVVPDGAAPRAGDVAARWTTLSGEPAALDGQALGSGVTIGAAQLSGDVATAGEALRRADVALHEAQRGGRHRHAHFEPAMDRAAQVRHGLQAALKLAIGSDEFFLEYQPQVAPGGELRGIEALARWRHPVRGPVRPDEFIPIAESAGLIGVLGLRVLELACADVVRARALGMQLPYVSVNVSPRQLSDPGLEDAFMRVLARHGLTTRDIELEVTESSLMESCDCDAVIHRFAQAGFRIAIDDFGTGYSSLSRLHSLPVHKLKIDRSFVMQIGQDGRGTAIVQSIMDLAQRLDLKTVAEGVETREQAAWLSDAGCSLMQGYLYARPMPFDRLMIWASDAAVATQPGEPTWAETAPVAL